MKSLSRLSNLVLSIVLIAAMSAAQISYCLHSTLLSSQHFTRILEDSNKLSEFTDALYRSLSYTSNSEEKDIFLRQYMLKVLSNTDQAWVRSQVYITAKGLHQYMFSGASTLPTLDIIPLKKTIRNILVSDIMKSEQARQKTEKIQTILSALDNKYFATVISLGLNNQLVSMLLELSPIRSTGFDKATIHEIISVYLSLSNKNISLEQASTSIAEQMTADMLRLNEIKDYFDLNLFMEKAFGKLDPLSFYKTFISAADKTVTRTVNILLWGTILLLAVHKRFRLNHIAKAAARCFLISSAFVFCISALLLNKALTETLLSHMFITQNAASVILTKYAGLLIRDLGQYLALQAVLVGLLSTAVLLLFSRVKSSGKKEKAFRGFPVIRLSLGISALLIVFIVISFISLSNEYSTFRDNLGKLSETDVSQSVKKGLIEAGGMEFLNLIEKE